MRQRIDGDMASQLIVAWFPKSAANWKDGQAEAAMEHVIEVNRTVRNIRTEKKLEAGARPAVFLRAASYRAALEETLAATAFTSRVDAMVVAAEDELPLAEYGFGRVADTEIAVALPEVDMGVERTRLEKELSEASAHAERLGKQLGNAQFRAKAPASVISGMEATMGEARVRAEGLKERLARMV